MIKALSGMKPFSRAYFLARFPKMTRFGLVRSHLLSSYDQLKWNGKVPASEIQQIVVDVRENSQFESFAKSLQRRIGIGEWPPPRKAIGDKSVVG
jgi:hypothetical protein